MLRALFSNGNRKNAMIRFLVGIGLLVARSRNINGQVVSIPIILAEHVDLPLNTKTFDNKMALNAENIESWIMEILYPSKPSKSSLATKSNTLPPPSTASLNFNSAVKIFLKKT
jgi:hypothetical protein